MEELNKFSDNKGLYNGSSGVVKKVEKKEKYEYAPKLFSLSDLQTEANKLYNFSAKQTLSIAQSLYEKKVTSYPRSDSNYIGTPEFDYLKTHLNDYLHLAKKKSILLKQKKINVM